MHPAQSFARHSGAFMQSLQRDVCLSSGQFSMLQVSQYGGEISDSCSHESVKATAGWSCQSGPLRSKVTDVVCCMHCVIRDVAAF